MENSRSVENIMSIKALTNDDTDLVQQRNNNNNHNNSRLDNSNNNNNSDSNSSINNTKNFNFVFETFNNGTMSKKKNNEGAILEKKNHISTSKSNNGDSIQGSQIRIFNAKELPNTNTKSIFNRQISMLVKNKEVTDTSQSSSNSLKKFGESVSDYNQSNNKNISLSSASRLNINSETSSPPPLVNTSSSSSSSSSSSTSPYLYLSNNKGRNDNKNNNSNSADNQPRRHKRKNSFSSQHEDDEKETNQEGEKKKKRKNYNYKKKADRLPNVNKLKKPRNGYMIYMNEVYKTVRDRHPQLRFGELSTLIGRQWKSLSKEEQQPYHDMHEKEKTDYDNAKVAMGTSKLHIVEETIDNIMAKKSAISAFSNASFAAFTSSPSASLPLSPQLPPQSKNTKFKKIPSSTKNGVAATNINTNFGKINDSLPTPPLTSPTIATITNNTSSTLSNLTSSSLSVSTTPDKLSAHELIRNKSSNSQALQYSSTIKTNNNINSPQNHTRIIFNENDDQSPLSSTRMLTAVDTRASSTEITPSTKWYLPFEGTSTSPGLSIFRKRKIKSIGETNNNDSDGMNVDNKLKKH